MKSTGWSAGLLRLRVRDRIAAMIRRLGSVRHVTGFALFAAILLFGAENTRGMGHVAADAGISHAHQQGGSPQGPVHFHSTAGDHSAHSHNVTVTPPSGGLVVSAPVLNGTVGHSLPVTSSVSASIEHPPRL